MRNFLTALVVLLINLFAAAQPQEPVVLQLPGMDKVVIEKGKVYQTLQDTLLKFDIYYPPGFDKKSDLPVVIFNNGAGAMDMPEWRVYKDWAKLTAVSGMAAITHQTRPGKSFKDSQALFDYLQLHASELKIDKDRFGVWACSANVGVGLPIAMDEKRKYIRSLVVYYGSGWREEDNFVKRQDLEILVVRAGLDFYNLNKGLTSFINDGLVKDAHMEIINYPEAQHAFDIFDNNERSRDVIRQTLSFMKGKLAKEYLVAEPLVLTTMMMRRMIVDERKTDATLAEFKKAVAKYRAMNHSQWYNHIIDDRNLNAIGYALLEVNRFDEALKVLNANAEAFPESPNVYDALGDAYEKTGDKIKSIENSKNCYY